MMAQQFPLYERLFRKVKHNHTDVIDIGKICSTITNIKSLESPCCDMHFNNIAALIIHHEILTGGALLSTRPYDIRVFTGGKGIIVKMLNLPKPLQQIIAEYIKEYSE